jgi:hypothetical protein
VYWRCGAEMKASLVVRIGVYSCSFENFSIFKSVHSIDSFQIHYSSSQNCRHTLLKLRTNYLLGQLG